MPLSALLTDPLLASVVARLRDRYPVAEPAAARLLARIVEDTAERLAKARRTFLHTDRPELFALREAVRELGGSGSLRAGSSPPPAVPGGRASGSLRAGSSPPPAVPGGRAAASFGQVWEQLARAGYMHIRDGRRRFSTPHGLLAHPTSDEIALAFAASGVRALEAERHFETICASLGRHQPPIWDDRFGSDGCRAAIAGLTLPGWDCPGTDAEYAVTASVLAPTQPNVFHALSALYATGASVDRYADEDGPGFLVLRLAPVDAN